MRRILHTILILVVVGGAIGAPGTAWGQVKVSGTIFDITKHIPLEAVSILSNSGAGTISDSMGRYSIILNENDSIWFSYLNRPTPKYPVRQIPLGQYFDISLHVNAVELKEVRVMAPNYRLDSIRNREEYAKAFNFRKPGLGSSINPTTGGVGLDLNELIQSFQFRKNRRMLAFRNRLLQEEEERYIDSRFSRALIIKLTGLKGKALDDFVQHYRPTVEFIESSTDYELQQYIKQSYSHYQRYIDMQRRLNPGSP